MGGGEPSGGESEEGSVLGGILVGDGIGGGDEPEEADEARPSLHGPIDVGADEFFGIDDFIDDGLELPFELLGDAIGCGDPLCPEGFGESPQLVLEVQVPGDPEQVARIGGVGEGAGLLPSLEDRDCLDDGVEWIARGGDQDMALRIFQAEGLVRGLDCRADDGILASGSGLAGLVLLASWTAC